MILAISWGSAQIEKLKILREIGDFLILKGNYSLYGLSKQTKWLMAL